MLQNSRPQAEVTTKRVPVVKDLKTSHDFSAPNLIDSLNRVVEFVSSSSSGGADALARLLLACYDPSEYPIEITELSRLDSSYYENALDIIRIRTQHSHEPHTFFENGGDLFNQIARDFGIEQKTSLEE